VKVTHSSKQQRALYLINAVASDNGNRFAEREVVGVRPVAEANIVRGQGPAHEGGVEQLSEVEHPPDERLIHATVVVGHSQEGDAGGTVVEGGDQAVAVVDHGRVEHLKNINIFRNGPI
jgi:hypothetical protein